MPLNRPFIDSQGKRGKPKATSKSVSRTKVGKYVRFHLWNKTHIYFSCPIAVRALYVNKKDGIRLAHWLLDECSK